MQQIVCYYISNHLSTAEERKELLKAFTELDVDSNGKLSREELKNGFAKVRGFGTNDVEEIFKKYDTDGSGMIDYSGRCKSPRIR